MRKSLIVSLCKKTSHAWQVPIFVLSVILFVIYHFNDQSTLHYFFLFNLPECPHCSSSNSSPLKKPLCWQTWTVTDGEERGAEMAYIPSLLCSFSIFFHSVANKFYVLLFFY